MFFGRFNHSLDDKGRLVIPSKMREQFSRLIYIMKGYDGALAIYKEQEFLKLVEQAEKLDFNKKNTRFYLRSQLASTCELELDKQGRVQIPTQLLNQYKIGKDVIIIGVGDHIEVWDKAIYEKYENEANENFEEIAENLKKDDE